MKKMITTTVTNVHFFVIGQDLFNNLHKSIEICDFCILSVLKFRSNNASSTVL